MFKQFPRQYNIYFWLRFIFVYKKPLKRTFKPVFWVQNHLLNVYSRVWIPIVFICSLYFWASIYLSIYLIIEIRSISISHRLWRDAYNRWCFVVMLMLGDALVRCFSLSHSPSLSLFLYLFSPLTAYLSTFSSCLYMIFTNLFIFVYLCILNSVTCSNFFAISSSVKVQTLNIY